ncbi:TPA: type II toxin-antitoxin system HicB family antitoxin [Candidatus Micrarchaeota archaeon]|nr:type II toxin-antitoxin system HicB family antitoxin [Candidatus Micrarchaeota archaeon]
MKLLDVLAVVFPEGKSYSAWSPEVDVASQGDTLDEAIGNLKEALELHLECLTASELQEIRKRQGTRLVTTLEIPVQS